jgi:hypothetical protein
VHAHIAGLFIKTQKNEKSMADPDRWGYSELTCTSQVSAKGKERQTQPGNSTRPFALKLRCGIKGSNLLLPAARTTPSLTAKNGTVWYLP